MVKIVNQMCSIHIDEKVTFAVIFFHKSDFFVQFISFNEIKSLIIVLDCLGRKKHFRLSFLRDPIDGTRKCA
jgi:hypothetical protein